MDPGHGHRSAAREIQGGRLSRRGREARVAAAVGARVPDIINFGAFS